MADSLLTLEELQLHGEGADLEVKAAAGRDGHGELPQDLWKTYSAMANTNGGVIYLGIREKPPGKFTIVGIEAIDKVRKTLWDQLHNRQTISHNLLVEEDVRIEQMAGRQVLRIQIPRATRHQKPVHLGTNPLQGTYQRRYEGDYQCSEEEVRRMLAEQVEEARDARLLEGFSLDDLDAESLRAYRQIPVARALEGGESDCRNRSLHQMFHLIGLGERSGFGMPKILDGWASQHWQRPKLYERTEPGNQTLLELRMIDLIPEPIVASLRARFGERFDRLDATRRLILVTAAMETTTNHTRLSEITDLHPHDLTRALRELVADNLLTSNAGEGRQGPGTVYFLPGAELPTPEEVFGGPGVVAGGPCVTERGPGVTERGPGESKLLPGVNLITSLDQLDPEQAAQLNTVAKRAKENQRLPKPEMEAIILKVCNGRYLTMRVLTELLQRTDDRLRKGYLNPMVRDRRLEMAFPTTPNHPEQAYRGTGE
jgi:predicted HTH transcriptional regulator